MLNRKLLILALLLVVGRQSSGAWAKDGELDLSDKKELDALTSETSELSEVSSPVEDSTPTATPPVSVSKDEVPLDTSKNEETDDLTALREDVGDTIVGDSKEAAKKDSAELSKDKTGSVVFEDKEKDKKEIVNDEKAKKKLVDQGKSKPIIFDVGPEEKELLKVSAFIQHKIPKKEWDEISAAAKKDKYVIQDGDWLWKISKNLFGSGFYYAKIWSLNPYITNPHEISAGMSLMFSTGDTDSMPDVALGSFDDGKNAKSQEVSKLTNDIDSFGEGAKPAWLDEKKKLLDQGTYVQYASGDTYEDLKRASAQSLNREYDKYEPPILKINAESVSKNKYDESGFDKDAKIVFKFKEGFSLNTFVSKNIIQDFGFIHSAIKEGVVLSIDDIVYIKFDSEMNVEPGDSFSVYVPGGKVSHSSSDRSGYKYTVVGSLKVVRRVSDLWECKVLDTNAPIHRNDRVTVYTPKMDRLIRTFNSRVIEAGILQGYEPRQSYFSYGTVVYIDRGRADGVELGNVFDVYGFHDRSTGKKITPNPTYKTGELTVITLTDDFATALVTSSRMDISAGAVAITKTAEEAARQTRIKNKSITKDIDKLKKDAADELDVELNLDDVNESLLDKADSIKLTEDELEELERQEREKSIIKENDRDLKMLEKLESEIESAEKILNEAKLDDDKLLEQQNLNEVEKKSAKKDDGREDLNGVEKDLGKKYLDENLNNKDNPYGLTDFDIEEVDELLNTDKDAGRAPEPKK